MSVARLWWLGIFVGMVSAAGWAQATIPPLRAESLAGNVVVLPDAGAKAPSLLVLGFSQKTTDDARNWVRRAGAAVPTSKVEVYTLPVLVEAPRFVRPLIVRSMRKDTPLPVQQHFVPIYDHEDEWKKAAQYDKPDEVYVLLVDAQGRIRWRVEGAVSDARLAELQVQLKALGG